MLLFGHLGITLGAGIVIDRLTKYSQKRCSPISQVRVGKASGSPPIERPVTLLGMSLTNAVFCALGSILSDIIDKPIGGYFFAQTFGHNGRIFSHSLLFLLVTIIAGLYFYFVQKKTCLLYLAFGVLMHLALDFMWQTPRTLFWPFLGWHFPIYAQGDLKGWLNELWLGLIHNPTTYVPEIIGFFAVMVFIFIIIKTEVTMASFSKKKQP